MLKKVDGFVLKTQDYGETHKIMTLFSQSFGKFAAIARGANRPKSKLAAISQPFILGNFLVYINKKGLSTIRQADILHSFRKIREDIVKTAYVAYIAELTDKTFTNFEPNLFMFQELLGTMERIHNEEEVQIPTLMYELKTYQVGGFAPVVQHCVICQRKEPLKVFSINEGGMLCEHCKHIDPQAIFLPPQMIRLLPIFLEASIKQIRNISVSEENRALLRNVFNQYYDQHGGFYLKSRKFLDQLDLLS